MKSLNSEYLQKQPITHNLLQTIRRIAEYTESSNRLEGITAPLERIKDLVAKKTTPRNRSEQEIAGYRDVLNTIHANHADIPFTTGVVLQFHRDLYQFLPVEGGKWKPADNEITEIQADGTKIVRFSPVPAHRTPDAMETLHERFAELWQSGEIEPLLLLYKAGYELGRYISLEQMIEQTKEGYYDTLYTSSQGWHEMQHAILPWWEYFLGVVLFGSCKEFERRVGLITTGRGTKTAMVLDAIGHFRGDFAIRDLQESCPHVGIDLIRRILREQKNMGKLECLGRGPNAKWRNR